MSDHLHLEPADWTCRICGATHPVPALACRRCGSALVPFARLAAAARRRERAGEADLARLLQLPQR